MMNDLKSVMLKSLVFPLPGVILYWLLFEYSFWIYLYIVYTLIIIPIWLILSNIKFLLKNNWKQFLIACMIMTVSEYIYTFSWPIGVALITNATGYKMILLLILCISSAVNILMLLIILGVKLIYVRKR